MKSQKSKVLGWAMCFTVSVLSLPNLGRCQAPNQIRSLRFVNEIDIEYNKPFHGTLIGGLSGIDYDTESRVYYLLSDDEQPRYYKARIILSESGIDSVVFLDNYSILWPSDSRAEPDPEGMRLNQLSRELVWTNEGERLVGDNIILSPSINIINSDDTRRNSFDIPSQLVMHPTERGPRRNGTLEGISFADDFSTLFVSVEEPLYDDGPAASLEESNAWVRFLKYDVATRKNVAQYAYKLEPIAHPAKPENAFKMNGVSDILAISPNRLLVIERSYSTGHSGCTIRVYECNLHGASDIKDIPSLLKEPPSKPIEKKLLLNMESLGIYIDNIEGMTFGPNFPNGHKSLIFVSDNNFNEAQRTQFLLFEVIP